MALTEQDRIRLYHHFEGQMGEELATKMMESLPPAGWGDLATKADLLATKAELDARLQLVEERLGKQLYRALSAQLLAFVALVGGMATFIDLF